MTNVKSDVTLINVSLYHILLSSSLPFCRQNSPNSWYMQYLKFPPGTVLLCPFDSIQQEELEMHVCGMLSVLYQCQVILRQECVSPVLFAEVIAQSACWHCVSTVHNDFSVHLK